ncbi:MAG: cytochrome P450 [Pseudonocardiaceae bacterium]|nr:cytochrome P450 [Pseudonocardiaceae bacterium]
MTDVQAPTFDPSSPEFLKDRYGTYRRLRDTAPLHETSNAPPTVLLTRHADVARALREPSVRMLPPGAGAPPWLGDGAAAEMFRGQMLFTDPPDHTRLRKVVTPAFRPKTVARLRDAIDRALDERIDLLREKNAFDAVTDLAEFVPAIAVCTILGIPDDDWPALIRGAVDFVLVLSPLELSTEQVQRADSICEYYLNYFEELVAERRRHPGGDDDFVTVLIRAQDEGDKLSNTELLATAHSVLNAGFETTMSALANGLQGMLGDQDQWSALCADPDLAPAAVEETLRWEAPAQILTRFAAEALVLDSGEVPAGTSMVIGAAAGNRDERRFSNPDQFDLHRPDVAHLSFGAGRHACIGAHLGRMELEMAFRKLAAAFPEMELVGTEAPREPNPMFPTLQRLDVVAQP